MIAAVAAVARGTGRATVAAALVALTAFGTVACSPTFDWRTVRPEGTAVESLWPCRPAVERRNVPLAGAERPMALHACATGGVRFALAVVSVDDAAQVEGVARALRRATVVNLAAAGPAPSDATSASAPPVARPWSVRGSTPNAASDRVDVRGRGADGRPIAAELGTFVNGTTVLQAIAVGETVPPDVAETFLAAFAVAP